MTTWIEEEAMPRLVTSCGAGRSAVWMGKMAGPGIVGVVFVVMLLWTGGRWADPVIDFGRELYVPWQVAQGKVLYVDVASFYGPFSALFNGLWFRVFGASVLTLVGVNLVVLAVATGLLYGMVVEVGGRLTGTICGVMFLALFGMAHLLPVGNFNFVMPYSHEATHGFTLCLAGVYFFVRYVRSRGEGWLWGMGICVGCVFLTKPELFVALVGAMGMGVGLLIWSDRERRSWWTGAIVVAGACVPVGVVCAYLASEMSWMEAGRGVLGSWRFMGNEAVTGSEYFRVWMGVEELGMRLKQAGEAVAWIVALMAPVVVVGWWMRVNRWWIAGVLGTAFAAIAMFALWRWQVWAWTGNSLLILLPVIVAWQGMLLIREWRGEAGRREARIVRLTVVVFSGLLLLKLGLYPRFQHYGFVLAGPALMMLIVAGVEWVPAWFERRGRAGWALRGGVLAMLVGVLWAHLGMSARNMEPQTYPLGEGNDVVMTDIRARTYDDAMGFLRTDAKAGDTLTVLPEGALLNFLTRRTSPVPYVSFLPSDVAMFGEEKLLGALEAGRPSYLAILDRPTPEFPTKAFGTDYGQDIRAWALANYVPVHLSGGAPLTGHGFGILLLRRKDLAGPAMQ
jgi:Dolichyl-phosphate-mannose-protein mannosyltransferase